MSSSTKEVKALISIIKSVLHGAPVDISLIEGVDYNVLFKLAKKHGVANTIADVICADEQAPADIKDSFKKEKSMIMAQQILMMRALDDLFEKLDENEIRGIFLKGTIIRDLYPGTFLRSMSDVDVFAEESDMEKIYSIMTSSGYEPGTIGHGNHYEYSLHEYVKVEYHPELVALDSKYGTEVFSKLHPEAGTVALFMDIWNHTLPIEGHQFALQLTPEYHYVYVIMHMMNHFLTAGTGIRSIMDVWVMNDHYAQEWDRGLINEQLERFGLAGIEKYAVALADRWFDLAGVVKAASDVDEQTLDAFESYILGSGTYGNLKNSISSQMGHNTSAGNKVAFLLKTFFLPYEAMKNQYPVLVKAPVLLPAMWIYRVFDIFHNRGASAKHKLNAALKPDDKAVKERKEMMDALLRF